MDVMETQIRRFFHNICIFMHFMVAFLMGKKV